MSRLRLFRMHPETVALSEWDASAAGWKHADPETEFVEGDQMISADNRTFIREDGEWVETGQSLA